MKNVLLLLLTIFFGCSKDDLKVIINPNTNNVGNYSVDLEQIPNEIINLFHQGFTDCDMGAPCILEAYNWHNRVQSLDSIQYVQYLNYWAYYDAKKYGVGIDTVKAILFKRINFSKKMFGVMPNKLDYPSISKIGNAMLNARLPVSVLSWATHDDRVVDFTTTVGMIDTCLNIQNIVGYKNLILQNLKIKHKNWIILFDKGYLKIEPLPNSEENQIWMDAGCVHLMGGPKLFLETVSVGE
jgi:hypothetical protein